MTRAPTDEDVVFAISIANRTRQLVAFYLLMFVTDDLDARWLTASLRRLRRANRIVHVAGSGWEVVR